MVFFGSKFFLTPFQWRGRVYHQILSEVQLITVSTFELLLKAHQLISSFD